MSASRFPGGSGPQPTFRLRRAPKRRRPVFSILIAALVIALAIFSLPSLLAVDMKLAVSAPATAPFPVTVHPDEKTIVTDPQVEQLLTTRPSTLSAAVGSLTKIFSFIAIKISELPLYQQLASVAGTNNLFVTIKPGYRAEEVASAFGDKLHWTAAERKEFIAQQRELEPDLKDGSTVPGTYFVSVTDPGDVAGLTNERFQKEVLARYSTTTEEQLPLKDALTVASMLERESGSWEDMRLISGVIWNRIFKGMNLQIDATLQYAEATNAAGSGGWWPSVEPADKYIKSAYNTYSHNGLPPSPIANPSLAAVLAALNPKKTDCLFYFHDSHSQFHCSKTYAEHVKLLKQYYGQGK